MTSQTIDAAVTAHRQGASAFDYLQTRGYVQDVSDADGLRRHLGEGTVTAYIGFDPTAPSLHVGHLMGIMMLAVLQRFGHRPIALAGGGTTMVGDPSGKTSVRPVMTEEEIGRNLGCIVRQFDRYIDFQGGRFDGDTPSALLVNNANWLLPLKYIEFLRDIGRHFSVNEMLAAETYKQRLETTGLNFVEFNYRIVQAYDFLHLYRTHGCTLQMGGSDQWGNIVAGTDLIRRVTGGKGYALVCPLITTSTGQKMGKSEGNSLWLDPAMTSPYDYYQYWVNVPDSDVARLMRLYTFLPDTRIDELTAVGGDAIREAKRVLAYESTALTHGDAAADEAQATAASLFAGRAGGTPLLDDPSVPTTEIPRADLDTGMTIADLYVRAGLASSRGEARRLAGQGGIGLDDDRVEDVDAPVPAELTAALLRVGKKRFRRVVVVEGRG